MQVYRDRFEHSLSTISLFDSEENTLENDASFLEQGIIDSTGVLELVEWLEDTFAMKVEDDELIPDNLDSVDQLVQFCCQKENLIPLPMTTLLTSYLIAAAERTPDKQALLYGSDPFNVQ